MSGGRPMPKRGNPSSPNCRHCNNDRVVVRGFLFCEKCDAGMKDDVSIFPTWKRKPRPA